MFNVGPLELLVLAVIGLVVLGPDKLPELARDAARLLRTLREVATGARNQLKDELGPEFADVDLRNLNPRTAVQRAVFGQEVDLQTYHPRHALQDMLLGEEEDESVPYAGEQFADEQVARPAPRPRPRPVTKPTSAPPMGQPPAGPPPFDPDAT